MKNCFYRIWLFYAGLLLMPQLYANIRLPRLISDGMVLQRNQPLSIWGWAEKGEAVTVHFNNKSYHAIADDQRQWRLSLPAMEAGGPYEMTISGNNELVVKDILIGDVWICSGQSNMEFTVGRAKDRYTKEIEQSGNNEIRQFLVKRTWNFMRQDDVESEGWKAAAPGTVLQFSAAAYFFGKALYEKYHIPVGLINASVGGTPAEAWTSIDGLKGFPEYIDRAVPYLEPSKVKEVMARNRELSENWYDRLIQDKGLSNGKSAWAEVELNTTSWKSLNVPGRLSAPDLKNVAGIIWMRKEIDVPAELAGKQATVYLGHITDQDSTFLNGVKIGATNSKHLPRKYTVPEGILKPGSNSITVRILNTAGNSEFYLGKRYEIVAGGRSISLEGAWKYCLGIGVEPFPASQLVNLGSYPSVLYNSMIAPLTHFSIKGVIWYQGEANVSRAVEYRTLFSAMITDWRRQWKQGDFPFLFVQLANLGRASNEPEESSWAMLREAQTRALKLPNTGMAVTHDIGEWNDIHPLNKLDVGQRLALWAEKVAYGEKKVVYSGPLFESMKIKGNEVIISFRNTGSGLITMNGDPLAGFAIAGPDRKFVWANSRIEKDKVIVWSDSITRPIAVRYAWAGNPGKANLYNKEGLPASLFRTDDW